MLTEALNQATTPDYKITPIDGSGWGAATLEIDSGSFRITQAQTAVAKLLLETDTPLTSQQIQDETGFTNIATLINSLRDIGIVHTYQKSEQQDLTII